MPLRASHAEPTHVPPCQQGQLSAPCRLSPCSIAYGWLPHRLCRLKGVQSAGCICQACTCAGKQSTDTHWPSVLGRYQPVAAAAMRGGSGEKWWQKVRLLCYQPLCSFGPAAEVLAQRCLRRVCNNADLNLKLGCACLSVCLYIFLSCRRHPTCATSTQCRS